MRCMNCKDRSGSTKTSTEREGGNVRPEAGKLQVGPCDSAEKVIRSDPRSGSGDAEESSLTGKASGLGEPFKWRRAEAERL